MLRILIIGITIFLGTKSIAQNVCLAIGTDIPYQHYVGINLQTENIDFSYRTGILVPPYSDGILNLLEGLGTDNIYINLLDAAYDFGWMNSLGVYYKFGADKDWYIGPEIRLDYLTASETSEELVESITGQSFGRGGPFSRDIELEMGMRLIGLGLRVGKNFVLDENNKHIIKAELSFSKYISSASLLTLNGEEPDVINEILDDLLWEDVFKPYGYVGGLGLSYNFNF